MTNKENARAGDAGVKVDSIGMLSTSSITSADQTQHQPGSDECISRLGRALRAGRIERDSWAFGFTLSLLRHNKRCSWIPSPKQLFAMRGLVAELAESTEALIDDGGAA